jgi:hypothetical protein
MSIDQIRNKVKGSIWQALAQSDVDLKSVSAEQQNKLVDTITDHMLLTINDIMDDLPKPKVVPEKTQDGVEEEKILWEGRPFLSLVESYTVTTERIRITRGLFGKDYDNYELVRIQDIDVSQNMSERIFGIGDIHILGHDASNPSITLRNVKDPQAVYETLRKAWLAARKRYGLQFREQM